MARLLIFACTCLPPLTFATAPLATQVFFYQMPEAGQVFLVWGVEGWQTVPRESRPPGTVVEFKMMCTPMARKGATFRASLDIPLGTKVDYGFQIRQGRDGSELKKWVFDGDYALTAAKNGRIRVRSAVALSPSQAGSRFFGIRRLLLLGFVLGLGLLLGLHRVYDRGGGRVDASPSVLIGATAVSLCLCLFLVRAKMLGIDRNSLALIPQALVASYYDVLYVLTITVPFWAMSRWFSRRPGWQTKLTWTYLVVALLSLVGGIANSQVVKIVGRPLNYQMLCYSDFLKSSDATCALLENLSFEFLFDGVAICVAMLLASRVLVRAHERVHAGRWPRLLRPGLAVTLTAYLAVAHSQVGATPWKEDKLANPLTSFVKSILALRQHPVLFTMKVDAGSSEFNGEHAPSASPDPLPIPPCAEIRNVVLFVLESVPAEYVEVYGGTYPVTPTLKEYRQHSTVFSRIYAHAPATSKSLVSILGSIYPMISHKSLTQAYPDAAFPTLSGELKSRGYRTAFFNAGDSRFQRGDKFLSHRQFDRVADYRSLNRAGEIFETQCYSFGGGVDEEAVVAEFDHWLAESPESPFFAMFWTIGTHYPYFTNGQDVDYGIDESLLNRYLNALRHSDQALGSLLQNLSRRNLLDSTLVVVVGDHGEAFGRHDQWVHSSNIYEENVHVPLILLNSALCQGGVDSTIGGHIDLAPTIMHILNFSSPRAWQGRSLFQKERSERVYFFCPFSDFLFGYREGYLKFIFNATTNSSEIYGLREDPQETVNLASRMPETIPEIHRHLSAWVQYHERYMKHLLGE
jgi:arylsulfatase A-like enzyme